MTNVLHAVGRLLCLQELLAHVFIGLQALLMGKKDLLFGFLQACNGNLRRSAAAKAGFLPVFTYHFDL